MFGIIMDGAGGRSKAQVYGDKKLATRTITSTETQDAVVDGRAYNINTGWIAGVSSNSALAYLYNGDDEDLFIDAIAVGLKNGSATDVQSIFLVSGPTGGTLVDAATDADMIVNRKVGDGKTFSSASKIYKATAPGQTLTGGTDAALFAQNDQGRLFATVDFLLPKGQAIGLRMDVAGSFNADVYAAFIVHKRKILG